MLAAPRWLHTSAFWSHRESAVVKLEGAAVIFHATATRSTDLVSPTPFVVVDGKGNKLDLTGEPIFAECSQPILFACRQVVTRCL